ncbi:hypothetical protein FQN52_009289 [Onygenales sp. PD_12]|nr:hypothetical protein FQN52_009289 [Onygenales sp. PD_12]
MFEDFSFSSPPKGDRGLSANHCGDMLLDCDSNLVSPLSSRCPSPVLFPRSSKDHPLFPRRSRSHFKLAPAPTSIPYSYSDKHRLSIGTLTKKLNAQSLENDGSSDSDEGRNFPITPPRSAHIDIPSIWLENGPLSPLDIDRDSAFSDPSPTSTPRFPSSRNPSFSAGSNPPYPDHARSSISQDSEQYSSLRQHRENISLLQCTASTVAETVRIALLLEDNGHLSPNEIDDDRHPSSLPPLPVSRKRLPFNHNQKNPDRSSTSEPPQRSNISSGMGNKVEKSRHSPQNSSYNAGFRKAGKSPQGLRRRSLVLAAVTAMVEAEAAEKEKRDRELGNIEDKSKLLGAS